MTDPLGLINNNGIAPPSSPKANANTPVEGPSFKDVLIRMLQQVRNKMVDAYNEIKDMRV